MTELSVIIPYCNEYPQNVFTIQNIAQELRDRVDFEIIAVNNFCDETAAQGREEDAGCALIEASATGNKWLKSIRYTDKLSHWQAKNAAVAASRGKFLYFVDAHCIVGRDSLYEMFQYYHEHHERLNGTIALPLTYKILEWRRLIYKLACEPEHGVYHYSFMSFRPSVSPYQVPCMSACGVMMTRQLYDEFGGWPVELGIYGGGEHFLNFTLAVLGKTVNIFPTDRPLHHHGEKRGYHWNGDDYTRNRIIATYMFGGAELARKFTATRKGNRQFLDQMVEEVIEKCADHRAMIKRNQVLSIEDWYEKWTDK
jgi:glycosyltransferase involved in cell wall biosynthesis